MVRIRVRVYSEHDARRAAELLALLRQSATPLIEGDRPPAKGQWMRCRPAGVKAEYGRCHELGTTALDIAARLLHVIGVLVPVEIEEDRYLRYVCMDWPPADSGQLMSLAGGLHVSGSAPVKGVQATAPVSDGPTGELDLAALASTIAAAAARIDELLRAKKALGHEVTRLNGVIYEILRRVDSLKSDLESSESDVEHYKDQARVLDLQIDEILAENQGLRGEEIELTARIAELEAKVTEQRQVIQDLLEAMRHAGVKLTIEEVAE